MLYDWYLHSTHQDSYGLLQVALYSDFTVWLFQAGVAT